MFKKDSLLILLVLTCSIFFSAGCGGGVGPESLPYQEYGTVERVNSLWFWIGVNETFTPKEPNVFFPYEGGGKLGSGIKAEKGKQYFFVDRNEYFKFVPKDRDELACLQHPNSNFEKLGENGGRVKTVLDCWAVVDKTSSGVGLYSFYGRSLRERYIEWLPHGTIVTAWFHHEPPQPPYAELGEVRCLADTYIWWVIQVEKTGQALPETLVLDKDGREVTELQAGKRYYFVSREEFRNFEPLDKDSLRNLVHPNQWDRVVWDPRIGKDGLYVSIPTVAPWVVPNHWKIIIVVDGEKVAPGSVVTTPFIAGFNSSPVLY